MKISIKIKFTVGLFIIIFVSGLALNILIRRVLGNNLESTIITAMKDSMKNSREYVRYRIGINNLPLNEEGLRNQAVDICQYFSTAYDCETMLLTLKGEKIESSIIMNGEYVDNAVKQAMNGKAVISVEISEGLYFGALAYPLSYGGRYIGLIAISKDYSDKYNSNTEIIQMLTQAEVGVFVLILLLSFAYVAKLTKPIVKLTESMKEVGEGDYSLNVNVNARSNDEIGILEKEFINMREKIHSQISTIKEENQKVIKLEKSRREFFNNVTHELKTPLTAISGYAQLLMGKRKEDSEFVLKSGKRIYAESERLLKLVLDLIEVSKGLYGAEEETKNIDMQQVLEDTCIDMGLKADKYYVEIEKDIGKGFIIGKSSRIRQLLINILDNAIKYSFPQEKIYVNASCKQGFYVIEVVNKGEEIPKEIYDNIFEAFIKSSKSKELGSSGLGLYICSEIVREHYGEIVIQNGSIIKVVVRIPVSHQIC
jgi:signal transduction histidine kinase